MYVFFFILIIFSISMVFLWASKAGSTLNQVGFVSAVLSVIASAICFILPFGEMTKTYYEPESVEITPTIARAKVNGIWVETDNVTRYNAAKDSNIVIELLELRNLYGHVLENSYMIVVKPKAEVK